MSKKLIIVLLLISSVLLNVVIGYVYYNTPPKEIVKEILVGNKLDGEIDGYFDGYLMKKPEGYQIYHIAQMDTVLGKFHTDRGYFRLPYRSIDEVRPELWGISTSSSGLYVKFGTNSTSVSAKWVILKNSFLPNMTDIGSSGIDLYMKHEGKWQFINSGIPKKKLNQFTLISNMDTSYKEFILYLPLFNGVEGVSIGVDRYSDFQFHLDDKKEKPIVYYGTSITQGASASRPGRAYPSILSRELGIESINLGFNGNGFFEKEIGNYMCEIDAQLYVVDCTPNSSPKLIQAEALSLVNQLHDCNPNTPILLVETIIRESSRFNGADELVVNSLSYIKAQNKALKEVFKKAKKAGITNIYYLKGDDLIGDDHEGTVDGTHLSDLGISRFVSKIKVKIQDILNLP